MEDFLTNAFRYRGSFFISWISRRLVIITSVLILLFFVSCKMNVKQADEEIQPLFSKLEVSGGFSNKIDAVPLNNRWWLDLNDEVLSELIEKALADNFSLRSVQARLEQARASMYKARADIFPQLDLNAGFLRSVQKFAGTDRIYGTDYNLGVLITSYEVDLWGRVRSTYEAARLDALATEEDLNTAAITLSSEVAGEWFNLVGNILKLKLLDEQIETTKRYLDVIETQFRKGLASAVDVLQQRQSLAALEGNRKLIKADIEVLKNSLAVLVGELPGEFDIKPVENLDFPVLPELPKEGIPVNCIRNRPDIKAAELRIKSANERLAAAIADRFPRLSLTIRTESSADVIEALFDNWLASIAANVLAPIFDAGARKAEVERQKAIVKEYINSYKEAVLNAVKEVRDALVREERQKEYIESIAVQLDNAERSLDRILDGYTKGVESFTRYLLALQSHQQLQQEYIAARQNLVLYRIGLYKAIGGSWRTDVYRRQGIKDISYRKDKG